MPQAVIMTAYTSEEQAFIDRFAADDDPPSSSAPRVALVNMITPTTRQKTAGIAWRLRTTGTDVEDVQHVVNKYKDDFDMYMIELYKWFPIPATYLDDIDMLMAKAIEKRIRDNVQKELAYETRKRECIEDIKTQDGAGEPKAAVRRGIDDYSASPTTKVAPAFEIPLDANVMRFSDHEPSTSKEKYVVFSYLEIEKESSVSIPGVEVIVKIHGVYESMDAASDRSESMHKMMRHKHLETCIGVLDAWLSIPPPTDAPTHFGNKEHDAIYEGRWSEKQKIEIEAVKAFHAHKSLLQEIDEHAPVADAAGPSFTGEL